MKERDSFENPSVRLGDNIQIDLEEKDSGE